MALSISILKASIRVYDFENTKDIIGVTNWNNLVINNLAGSALQ